MHEPSRLAPLRMQALALWCVGALALALLLRGAVTPADQAVLHVILGVGAAVAATLPGPALAGIGAARRFASGAALVLLALGVGLLPLPAEALRVVAPGIVEARPADAFHTLAYDAEAAVSELATAALVLGYALVVGVWGAVRRRRHQVERAIVSGVALLVTAGLVHRVAGLQDVFGVISTSGARPVLHGPLVNENHMGTLVLLGLPVAAAQLFEHDARRDLQWGLALYVLVSGLALLVVIGSAGVFVAGAVVAALAVISRRGASVPALLAAGLGVAAVGAALAAGFHAWFAPVDSVAIRQAQWRDTMGLVLDHWISGVGGGSYAAAFEPYRADGMFRSFTHAHSDPLEWIAETGLIGLLLGVGVAAAWWPRAADREPERARAVELGLIAALAHALLDFPLQIPAVAMAVLAVLACRAAVFGPRAPSTAWAWRALLVALAAAQAPLAAWQWRTGRVEAALLALEAAPRDALALAEAEQALSTWAPWRAERGVARAWQAELAGDAPAAVEAARAVVAGHPEDPGSLRRAGLVLARAGRLTEAEAALERAGARAPQDQRTWIMLARVREAAGDVEGALGAWDQALFCSRPGQNVVFEPVFALRPDAAWWVPVLADSHADWSAHLGMLALRKGQPGAAVLALEQAARLDPAVYAHDLRIGEAFVAAGREAEAEAWLRQRLAAQDDAEGWSALGAVLARLGRHAEATEAYLAAIDRRPSDVAARVAAIHTIEAGQGAEAALKALRRFEASGHGDARLSIEAARLLRDRGDQGACIREIESRGLLQSQRVRAEAEALLRSCGGAP